jgi:hypothetical protein
MPAGMIGGCIHAGVPAGKVAPRQQIRLRRFTLTLSAPKTDLFSGPYCQFAKTAKSKTPHLVRIGDPWTI